MNYESVWMRIGENLAKLLDGLFGRRMASHVAVQNSPRSDLHRHKYIQDLERSGDRNEEIAGHDGLGMVANEGAPALVGTVARFTGIQILPCSRRNVDAKFETQFIGNPFLSPSRVPSHCANQFLKIPR